MYKIQTGKFKGERLCNVDMKYLYKFYAYLHHIPRLTKNQREDFNEVCLEFDRRK